MHSYTMINLGGKKWGFQWGKYASGVYVSTINKKDEEPIDSFLATERLSVLVYSGLRMAYYTFNKPVDFKLEDVIEWSEQISEEDQIRINQSLLNSLHFHQISKPQKEQKVKELTTKQWWDRRKQEIGFAMGELNLTYEEYGKLTDWEFEFMVEGYYKRRDLAVHDLRFLAYPLWNQNSEKKPPRITDWLPIPSIDQSMKKTNKKNKAEIKQLKELAELASRYS